MTNFSIQLQKLDEVVNLEIGISERAEDGLVILSKGELYMSIQTAYRELMLNFLLVFGVKFLLQPLLFCFLDIIAVLAHTLELF